MFLMIYHTHSKKDNLLPLLYNIFLYFSIGFFYNIIKEVIFLATGKIFSIEEFSTYDGPGIRMTVFLKGCPLRCNWCHNPEGQRFESEMLKSPNGCLGCGACLSEGKRITGRACLVANSAKVCPLGLVRVCGTDVTPDELITKIDKNIAILNASGGGVTFSGGEPLCHSEFVRECLSLLRGKTHRAIQTCGYSDAETLLSVLAECDFVLYDLKLIDNVLHKRYTGVSNEKILENYRLLSSSGIPFITRIPLIPTVNDTEENIIATAEFMRENGAFKVELLPYNKMAGGKYELIGQKYTPDFDGSITPEPHTEIFNKYGIEAKIL